MSEKTGEELVVDDRQLQLLQRCGLYWIVCEQIVNREDFTKS